MVVSHDGQCCCRLPKVLPLPKRHQVGGCVAVLRIESAYVLIVDVGLGLCGWKIKDSHHHHREVVVATIHHRVCVSVCVLVVVCVLSLVCVLIGFCVVWCNR